MNVLIVYYSLSGNNKVLAEALASKIGARCFELKEEIERSNSTIFIDQLFKRKSKLTNMPFALEKYDLVICIGPVWLFHLCSPLRTFLKRSRKMINKCIFLSLSGGALGINDKLAKELKKILGKKLAFCFDMNIVQLCSIDRSANIEESSSYQLKNNSDDLEKLLNVSLPVIKAFII